jgi:beta-glucanase (GH16 family)
MPFKLSPALGARVACLAGALFLAASAAAADPTWTLTWSDDFNGAANSAPDPTRWTYDQGGGGWGNGELETYTTTTANAFEDGSGHLVIQALNNGGYSSARIKSQGLFDQAYGRVEASLELPAGTAQGSGLWPAFWMLGSNIGPVGWPACGEIDIMENIGQYNTAIQNGGHIHGPLSPGGGDYNGGGGVGTTYTLPAGQAFNTGYHLFAAEWNPSTITFYVDGSAYQTLSAASLPSGGQWVFNHPFFIIINLAIGGAVGGPVTCSFPQQLLVDYVRVYKLTDNGCSPYGGTAAAVPGSIQAENYDSYSDAADPGEPGEGFAYNGLASTQTNGVFRTGEAISTENCSDAGGGYDCDYSSPGQWLQYGINVAQAGSYALDARVASSGQGGSFHFDVDGSAVGPELSCPDTGGWQSWADVSATGISLSTGPHELLLVEDSMGAGGLGVCNFNNFTLSLEASPSASPTRTETPSKTCTPSPSLSPSRTPSPSPATTLAATHTPSPSPSPQSSPGPAPSATLSPQPDPSADPAPQSPGPPGGLAKVLLGPNPGDGGHESLLFELDGSASLARVLIFSRASTLLLDKTFSGSFVSGWNTLALPALNFSNDVYFVRVEVGQTRKYAALLILR